MSLVPKEPGMFITKKRLHEDSEEAVIYKPRREPFEKIQPPIPHPRFLAFKLLFEPSGLWLLLWRPQQANTFMLKKKKKSISHSSQLKKISLSLGSSWLIVPTAHLSAQQLCLPSLFCVPCPTLPCPVLSVVILKMLNIKATWTRQGTRGLNIILPHLQYFGHYRKCNRENTKQKKKRSSGET